MRFRVLYLESPAIIILTPLLSFLLSPFFHPRHNNQLYNYIKEHYEMIERQYNIVRIISNKIRKIFD